MFLSVICIYICRPGSSEVNFSKFDIYLFAFFVCDSLIDFIKCYVQFIFFEHLNPSLTGHVHLDWNVKYQNDYTNNKILIFRLFNSLPLHNISLPYHNIFFYHFTTLSTIVVVLFFFPSKLVLYFT